MIYLRLQTQRNKQTRQKNKQKKQQTKTPTSGEHVKTEIRNNKKTKQKKKERKRVDTVICHNRMNNDSVFCLNVAEN